MRKIITQSVYVIALLVTIQIKAATITAIASGSWSSTLCWDLGRTPQCGDTIVVPAGICINVSTMQNFYSSCTQTMLVNVWGQIHFQGGKKLCLPCNSVVEVFTGGKVTCDVGGGSSNYIEICNYVVWSSGDGTANGPEIFSYGALPVKLLSFGAEQQGRVVKTNWLTASEQNSSFFVIERSADGFVFEEVGMIAAAGNSGQNISYSFSDEKPMTGWSYYRLVQYDQSGAFKIFDPVAVEMNLASSALFPNPSNGNFTVSSDKETDQVEIFDCLGNCMFKGKSGNINLNGILGPGAYYIRINGKSETQRLIVY